MPRSSLDSASAGLAHAFRPAAVLAIEGGDRVAFLQGQLTQDVRNLPAGAARLAAGLTPQGKLLYFGRLVAESDRFLFLLSPDAAAAALATLSRYAAFQKVAVRDLSAHWAVASLYGAAAEKVPTPAGGFRLPPWGELAAEILLPEKARPELAEILAREGSIALSPSEIEVRRVEAGRPEFGREAAPASLPRETGLDDAIAPDKGCYVGQEVVARLRTYARVNRRLAGLRFPDGPVAAGTAFPNPEKPSQEWARVTSVVASPRFGPIGLGLVHRDVADGASLRAPGDPAVTAVVTPLPFA